MIGKVVKVVVDRPLGTHHPKHNDLIYNLNYGYVPEIFAPDGEEQDAYILGADKPVSFSPITLRKRLRIGFNSESFQLYPFLAVTGDIPTV